MFLLKNSNLVSLNLGGRGFTKVFPRIEKEINMPWKKMEMAVRGSDLRNRPRGELVPRDGRGQVTPHPARILSPFLWLPLSSGCSVVGAQLPKHLPTGALGTFSG